MSRHSQLSLGPMPVNPVVPTKNDKDKSLVLKRGLLRDAIDLSGWKHDAVAAALKVDGPYLSKMLAGDKPITLRHLDALPDDVEAIYSRLYAKAMGSIVVSPCEGEDAVERLVSGLFGLLRGARKEVA